MKLSVHWAPLFLILGGALSAQERAYPSDDSNFPNPDRGFYVPFDPIGLENSRLRQGDLSGLRKEGVSLVRRIYTLRAWRNTPLPRSFLDQLRAEWDLLRKAGLKLILRFAYNWTSENGTQTLESRPDAPRSRILEHLSQLKPLLTEFEDMISHVQAGFVGHYGEWHHSTSGLVDNRTLELTADGADVLKAILETVPSSKMVCVRYPYWHKERRWPSPLSFQDAFGTSSRSRLGFHNDAFRWDKNVNAGFFHHVDTRGYVAAEAEWVLVTGEMGEVNNALQRSAAGCIEEFKEFRFSVFNRERGSVPTFHAWRTQRRYDEIARRLGYRLRLVSAHWAEPKLRLRLANDGFARVLAPRAIQLHLSPVKGGKAHVYSPDLPELRRSLPGSNEERELEIILSASDELPAGQYHVGLRLPDPHPRASSRPEYCIRLANRGIWNEMTGVHDLRLRISISKKER